ncbi:acyl carrier protein [Meira miltonrushii]|uniref:Acyl carrier protein n=1 Tax=Meira miltonrushii TaxID=1280837 RepID=A0A316VAU7_9BASI|nr:acyl carrier protein [Meira miltonrushii]PWN34737.1 acyl carrier protein [Meira miltonrushii]
MSAMRATSLLRATRANAARSMTMSAQRNLSSMVVKPSFVGRQLSRSSGMLKVPAFQTRAYAASSGLSNQEIQNRIFEVLKSFEKVDPAKISASAAFTTDLGLDSLDAVEVVMAIEEEFSIDIPDAEADNITSVQEAIDYISKTPSAH